MMLIKFDISFSNANIPDNNHRRKKRRIRKAAVNTERRLNEAKSNGYVKGKNLHSSS